MRLYDLPCETVASRGFSPGSKPRKMSREPDWFLTCVFSMELRSRRPSHATLLISASDTWVYHRTVLIYLSDCVSRIVTSLHLWKLLKRSSQAWHRQKMMNKVSNLQKYYSLISMNIWRPIPLASNYVNDNSLPSLDTNTYTHNRMDRWPRSQLLGAWLALTMG